MHRATVPPEPFVAILSRRLEELKRIPEINDPMRCLAQEARITERMAHRLLTNVQESLGFDPADRIVTYLVGPMAWHTDDTLREIYENVDLAAVDRRRPLVAA